MSGKKIAITLFKYFPYGGLQKDFLGIAEELCKRGHTVKVFTRSWSGEIPTWLDVMEIGEKGFTNASKNRKFVNEVSEVINQFNPEIVFGFNKMPGLDLYFAADTCFAKHSLNKHYLQRFTKRFKQSLVFETDVFSHKSSTKILLLNNRQKNEFKDIYKTPEERMQIIPPGINRDWLDAIPIDTQEELQISPSDKILLFVGSDFFRKGLDRAILGLHYLNNNDIPSTLVVIGDDNEKGYFDLIKDSEFQSKIKFMGPRDDVASFMKSADLLIHPAREEAAGNIIIEAIVSGLPALASKEVGFSEEILKFKSGSVLDRNFSQDAFNSLLEATLSEKNLGHIKSSIKELKNEDYFFSRFSFVADYVESNF